MSTKTSIESITYVDTDDPALTEVTVIVGPGGTDPGTHTETRLSASCSREQWLLDRQGWTSTELQDGSIRYEPQS